MEMTSAREAGEISLRGSIKFVPEFLWPLVEVPADSYLCHCIQLCVHFLRAYFIEGVLYTGKKKKLYKMGNCLSTPVSHRLRYFFFSLNCQNGLKSALLQPDMKV